MAERRRIRQRLRAYGSGSQRCGAEDQISAVDVGELAGVLPQRPPRLRPWLRWSRVSSTAAVACPAAGAGGGERPKAEIPAVGDSELVGALEAAPAAGNGETTATAEGLARRRQGRRKHSRDSKEACAERRQTANGAACAVNCSRRCGADVKRAPSP